MSNRPIVSQRKGSASSAISDSASTEGDGVSLLKARSAEGNQPGAKLPFFERYKQMVESSSSPKPSSSPLLRVGALVGQVSDDDYHEQLVASPVQTNFSDGNEDGEGSALPWATPQLAASPVITQSPMPFTKPSRLHARHRTAESAGSSNSSASSSRSGRFGLASGPESEEVVTPSQSWEGELVERAGGANVVRSSNDDGRKGSGYEMGMENRDILEQIGEEEEDEGERVVFGAITPSTQRGSEEQRMKGSTSASTITPHDAHSRSRTVPEVKRCSDSSTRRKTCQKCGETVGGSKRFVERDGVVLCERDWKKLYLPSCRRCNLPIEKSAVSSSDGQLKGKWHRACFTCTRCDKPFEGDSFYVHGGKPWCQQHYHEEK